MAKKTGLAGSLLLQKTVPQKKKQENEGTSLAVKPDTNAQSTEVPKLRSTELRKLRSYEVPNFNKMKRLDIRITKEQKRYLDDLEDEIREQMPTGESGNPLSRRITKAAIVRVMIEVFRQCDLPVDATGFKNENDLMKELYKQFQVHIKQRSTELP